MINSSSLISFAPETQFIFSFKNSSCAASVKMVNNTFSWAHFYSRVFPLRWPATLSTFPPSFSIFQAPAWCFV